MRKSAARGDVRPKRSKDQPTAGKLQALREEIARLRAILLDRDLPWQRIGHRLVYLADA
ncbi:hypothetical protein [Bradyrhizobium genosp. P]|uniref:hypothetical protein n=1 Tax=Bradyrhizobium genosp. P TaxID=83641 RepID=UPI003CED241F